MTYADPPGNWSARNAAVASADVQIEASGTVSPERRSRADRSRGVKIELFVRTRNGRFLSTNRCRNSAAPGRACSSRTSTPSMSVSQHCGVERTGPSVSVPCTRRNRHRLFRYLAHRHFGHLHVAASPEVGGCLPNRLEFVADLWVRVEVRLDVGCHLIAGLALESREECVHVRMGEQV